MALVGGKIQIRTIYHLRTSVYSLGKFLFEVIIAV